MGSDNSKQTNELDLANEYINLKTEYDQRFGEVTVYKHKRLNELVLVKDKIFDSSQLYEKFRQMAEIRSKMNHEHISTVIYSKCTFNLFKNQSQYRERMVFNIL